MRFFHRFQTINYRFFGLVNGIMLNKTAKDEYTKILFLLNDKYSKYINEPVKAETSSRFPNKIWQLWLQGKDEMPPIIRKCTQSVKEFHKDNVILLTQNELKNYVEIPEFIIEKYKKRIIPPAHFSDIIRLILLAQYGGCWIDASVFLTDKIPADILNADFFSFKSRYSLFIDNNLSLGQFKMISNNFNSIIEMETPYFFSAKPASALINTLLNLLLHYWENENTLIDYLIIDKFFILTVVKNKKCRFEYLNMPIYYRENTLLLQHALFERFNKRLFERIKAMSSVHKLTYKNLHRNPYKNSFLMHILNKK